MQFSVCFGAETKIIKSQEGERKFVSSQTIFVVSFGHLACLSCHSEVSIPSESQQTLFFITIITLANVSHSGRWLETSYQKYVTQ